MTWISDGRERNKRIKNVVYDCTTLIPKTAIRVSLGQGTAFRWATIKTPRTLRDDERQAITTRLLDENLIGQYWDDMDPVQHPCVHFNAPRVP